MSLIILNEPERQTELRMDTSRCNHISNGQNKIVFQHSIDSELREKEKFGPNTAFIGNPNTIYNCHGLTFASKRTGIFLDETISLILDDEYTEVEWANVIVGDIVVYYYSNTFPRQYAHSSLVVEKTELVGVPNIKVLSKTRYYREIVHYVQFHPYIGTEYKFYRIKHEPITIL